MLKEMVVSCVVGFTVAAQLIAQVDPGAALGEGRAQIAQKQFDAAAKTLSAGLVAARTIADDQQRAQALGALHFYSAVALVSAGREAEAREDLEQFFALMPNVRSVDSNKYDAAFVKFFNDVAGEIVAANDGSFDRLYPGYTTFVGKEPEPSKGAWSESPEFVLLATREEKKSWNEGGGSAREKFISDFWERRDSTPGDGRNEFRNQFMSRVAFADAMFTTDRHRGALSGRGRVFVLLGKPASVKERALERGDGVMSPGTSNNLHRGKGEIETWGYLTDQLPAKVPGARVAFKFATQQYHGDHALTFETKAERALTAAAEASVKKR